jgi:hypothetical protein
MKFTSILFTLALVSNLSFANVITVENSDKTVEGVKIARSATLATDKGDVKLDLVGAGLRTKKVLVANVKVYVTQLLVDNVGKFVRTNEGALKSIDDMNVVAFTLSFLRDVDGPTVSKAFQDSFDANNVDSNNAGIKAFLNAVNVSGQADNGKTMSIVVKRLENNTAEITYEATNGKVSKISGDVSLVRSISSIWIGASADKGLETLKAVLIKGE